MGSMAQVSIPADADFFMCRIYPTASTTDRRHRHHPIIIMGHPQVIILVAAAPHIHHIVSIISHRPHLITADIMVDIMTDTMADIMTDIMVDIMADIMVDIMADIMDIVNKAKKNKQSCSNLKYYIIEIFSMFCNLSFENTSFNES